jgi:abortive infection bacteriophage resistance protein
MVQMQALSRLLCILRQFTHGYQQLVVKISPTTSKAAMNYSKPWLSVPDQLNLLQQRGMIISDQVKAAACLQRIGYYRLSGYWYAFRERSGACCAYPPLPGKRSRTDTIALDSFKPGASFQNAVDLYVFDKQLRLLAMDALERVEIALRVEIAHTLGEFDAFAYFNPDFFHAEFSQILDPRTGLSSHHSWLTKHAQLISRSHEDFVKHNKNKHGLPLAIWVACEVWDFGAMSKLFAGMRETEQDRISQKFGVKNGRIFTTWLHSLNQLRNVCAHHCRLWNRNITAQPKLPSVADIEWVQYFKTDTHAQARCYLLLVIANQILGVINPGSLWNQRMSEHLTTFPNLSHLGLNLRGMGAIDGWDAFTRT